jgi:hypothetical protein
MQVAPGPAGRATVVVLQHIFIRRAAVVAQVLPVVLVHLPLAATAVQGVNGQAMAPTMLVVVVVAVIITGLPGPGALGAVE